MTADDAFAQAVAAPGGERLHVFETVCVPRGACRREPLAEILAAGHGSGLPTLFDEYGSPVNPMYAKVH